MAEGDVHPEGVSYSDAAEYTYSSSELASGGAVRRVRCKDPIYVGGKSGVVCMESLDAVSSVGVR